VMLRRGGVGPLLEELPDERYTGSELLLNSDVPPVCRRIAFHQRET
jgi:hypothetical protein